MTKLSGSSHLIGFHTKLGSDVSEVPQFGEKH